MLRGSLYLAWGMEAEASRIFAGLLDTRADPAIRDQAWFHIARLRYRHGRHAEAAAALARIGDALPARLAPERAYLQAQLALGQAPADPALADARLDPDDPWAVYARYNLGVVLLREGQDAAGEAALARVAGLRTASSELQALADRARIALAYHHLRREDPAQAGQALLGVRLHGPMADRALLALGWARARQERFDLALVPWTELAGRDVLEPAVQEGLLARPWALARLGDEAGALEAYRAAAGIYEDQLAALDQALARIRDGRLLQDLGPAAGAATAADPLPARAEFRYLTPLLASNRFQTGLLSYRELRELRRRLGDWGVDLEVFQTMLATRREGYAERLPKIDRARAAIRELALDDRRRAFEAELERIAREEDILALARAKERGLLKRLERAEARLERIEAAGGGERTGDARTRLALYRGLLYWQIAADFTPRLWSLKKSLRELKQALNQNREALEALEKATREAPRSFEGYGARIQGTGVRIENLATRADALLARQEAALEALAEEVILSHRARLADALSRARFAVAQLLDRATGVPADGDGP